MVITVIYTTYYVCDYFARDFGHVGLSETLLVTISPFCNGGSWTKTRLEYGTSALELYGASGIGIGGLYMCWCVFCRFCMARAT